MKKVYSVCAAVLASATLLSACGGRAGGDLLTAIKSRGYMLVATDANYAPQSFINTEGTRPASTKCPKDALTTAEMQGFDVDVAAELGKRLGVETCFATPVWDTVVAGNWGDKWDISVGSMPITLDRRKVFAFTTAYYYTPAGVAVTKESGITSLDQLADQSVCVGATTPYEDWLKGGLNLPPEDVYAKPPSGVMVVSLDTDQECAQAIQEGRKGFVGYVTAEAVIDADIAAGLPVVKLHGPVFAENLAVAIDKSHTRDISGLVTTLDGFIKSMHTDGTLSTLSNKWFQVDLTQAPAH